MIPRQGSRFDSIERKTYVQSDSMGIYSMSISNVTNEDSGTFACVVFNSLVHLDKRVQHAEAKVSVIGNPKSGN